MSRPDATASAALSGDIKPVFFAHLDFLTAPVRANNSGRSFTFPIDYENADLAGQTFDGISSTLIRVGEIRVQQNGTDSITVSLSGINGLDDDQLDEIETRANWQGRTARFYRLIRDAQNVSQGGIQHYYTGYMVSLNIAAAPQEQTINMRIEGYLAAYSEASNKTYLSQEQYDAGDLSARAAIAIANGTSGNSLVNNTPTGQFGGGGGGGFGSGIFNNTRLR